MEEVWGPGAGMDTEAGAQPFPEAVLEPALGGGQSGRSASGRHRADPRLITLVTDGIGLWRPGDTFLPLGLLSPSCWLQQGE